MSHHPAHVINQTDQWWAALIGKRRRRHVGIRCRKGKRAPCGFRTMEVERRPREQEDRLERQEEAVKPTDLR